MVNYAAKQQATSRFILSAVHKFMSKTQYSKYRAMAIIISREIMLIVCNLDFNLIFIKEEVRSQHWDMGMVGRREGGGNNGKSTISSKGLKQLGKTLHSAFRTAVKNMLFIQLSLLGNASAHNCAFPKAYLKDEKPFILGN